MPTKEQDAEIRWALAAISSKEPRYRRFQDYYAGRHPMVITEERLERVFKGLFRDFRMNLCGVVVDSLTDRLQIASFSGDEEESEDALEIWKRNRMHRRAGQLHQVAIAAGDAYAIVWTDRENRPTIYPQKPSEMVVDYDPDSPGTITRAAKLWKEADNSRHLTLFYPDRIEKYYTDATVAGFSDPTFMAFREKQVQGEAWPLTNPYGQVPVFHFANNGDLGEFGVSELTDAVPIQDALNKTVMDMLVANEYQAYPQRYALNVEIKHDANGNPINPFTAGPERIWALADSSDERSASLGQFDAADTRQMVAVKQDWALSMAQVTQTPAHYFMMGTNMISGESMKTAEQKLDAKVSDRQISFGDAWSGAMSLAVRMLRNSSENLLFDTNWKDTKPRNEKEDWEIAELKAALGVSKAQILRERGYSEEQIEMFAGEDAEIGLGQEPEDPVTRLTRELNGNGFR